MQTVTEHIRHRLLERAGLVETPRLPSLDELRKSEWLPEFETLMRNRLLLGSFRYGLMSNPNKGNFQILKSIRDRLAKYDADRNLEHLVDVANLCLVEFLAGSRRGQTLTAVDDGDHCQPL